MTAELVMVLPLLVVVTAALAWLLATGTDQLRLVDAAREVARAVARGDDRGTAFAAGRAIAPNGAVFEVSEADGFVTVEARALAAEGGLAASLLPEVVLHAEAVALAERAEQAP